jgi:hypothetical protein
LYVETAPETTVYKTQLVSLQFVELIPLKRSLAEIVLSSSDDISDKAVFAEMLHDGAGLLMETLKLLDVILTPVGLLHLVLNSNCESLGE